MCGIIGYIGNKEIVPVLIGGLKRLEYRGYDSAGIAVVQDGGLLQVCRSAGKLSNLEDALNSNPLTGIYGIGHTRWATHGRPTEENAHPHRDCKGKIVVVHNGIIENYLSLKANLTEQGHKFITETDTEIIAHLVEKYYEGNLEKAVTRAFKEIEGVYSCAILSADEPRKIIGVRNGPPMVVGIGEKEFFVASDITAILHHTRDIIFLENREMAVITDAGVKIQDLDSNPIQRSSQKINWDPIMAEKGGYKHYMLKEIFEQPRAIRETMMGRVSMDTGKLYLDDLEISSDELAQIEKINILAAGTSWHAALVGKFWIEEMARIPVEVDISSEFRYRNPVIRPKTLTIAVSQSGETADTIAAIKEAKDRGSLTLSISNVKGSQITRDTQGTIYTHAGPEIGVAATKTFTAQLIAFYMLAVYLAKVRKQIDKEGLRKRIQALHNIANLSDVILQKHKEIEELSRPYVSASDFLFLGRGINYPIALEGALKLKEISYIHAEGYPAGEMKHGPIALIDENMPVVVLMPQDSHHDKIFSNIQEAKAREGRIIAIATEGDKSAESVAERVFYIPEADPWLYPILCVLPLQLMSYYIAIRRGCDVDQPRNLAKSVTVE